MWVDGAADWAMCASQLGVTGDVCELVREWMAGQGFRVVTTSMVSLLRAFRSLHLRHGHVLFFCSSPDGTMHPPSDLCGHQQGRSRGTAPLANSFDMPDALCDCRAALGTANKTLFCSDARA